MGEPRIPLSLLGDCAALRGYIEDRLLSATLDLGAAQDRQLLFGDPDSLDALARIPPPSLSRAIQIVSVWRPDAEA